MPHCFVMHVFDKLLLYNYSEMQSHAENNSINELWTQVNGSYYSKGLVFKS